MTLKLLIIFLAFVASSCFTKNREALAEEVIRKPIKDGFIVARQESVAPVLPTAEKQAELNRALPGAVYSMPDSAVELSVVKITSLGESLLWRRTASQYSSGTHFQMLDVLLEGDSCIVLYQYIAPSLSFVYAEVITPQHPFSQVRSKNARFALPVYSIGPFVQSALLKGSFSQNDLSAEVNLRGGGIPLLFVYDGKQWIEQKPPNPVRNPIQGRVVPVDPDAAYKGAIELQKYPTPDDTFTVVRRLLRPESAFLVLNSNLTQGVTDPRSFMYQFQFDSSRAPFVNQTKTLWSQRVDNVTNDEQLWRILDADYNAETQVLVYVYGQKEAIFANVVRPDANAGQTTLSWSAMRLPIVDASTVEKVVVENGTVESSPELTLNLSTKELLHFRLSGESWVAVTDK